MKVLYDYQVFNMQNFGGISRYFMQMMEHFHEHKSLDFELPIQYTDNFYIKHSELFQNKVEPSKDIKAEQLFFGMNFKGRARVHNLVRKYTFNSAKFNQNLSIEALKKGDFDVFQPTFYDPYFLDYIGDKPYVMFVPDMINEKYAEFFMGRPGWETIKWKRMTIMKAARVMVISEEVKQDLVDIYNYDPDKIDLVYLSSDLGNDSSKATIDINKKYILYVGNRANYKNFYLFLHAFEQLTRKHPDLHLICSGGGNFPGEDLVLMDLLDIKDKVEYISADNNANLAYLYQNARFFAYPSIAEGFGIPLCEAFENDCPVVASNIKPFKEVGGEAVVYFDPKDVHDMVNKMNSVLKDEDKRKQMIKDGKKQVELFNAQNTAKATLESYTKIKSQNTNDK